MSKATSNNKKQAAQAPIPHSNIIQRPGGPVPGSREIFLAGGCFWGAEAYLGRINGVLTTDVGYANCKVALPTYERVCAGNTGCAETVRVVYNPDLLPLARLLELYFEAIDPCAVGRQGPDVGDQYRTGIYYVDAADLPVIQAALEALGKTAPGPVAVESAPLENYWAAEPNHQKYLQKNPDGHCHIPAELMEKAKKANR